LADAGIETSVESAGKAHGDALAESVTGLLKTEVIWLQGPWRPAEDVEFSMLSWVD
jgi:transposase InsO family protein